MNITLIGTGGVAENLALVFHDTHTVTVVGKSSEALSQLIGYNNLWKANVEHIPKETEILILAIQDDKLLPTIQNIDFHELTNLKAIVHTSGSTSIDIFNPFSEKGAVFYPLQTFTKNKVIEWGNLPILIEAHSKEIESLLCELADEINANPIHADSKKRAYIHLGAVFSQNFFNFLLEVAHQIVQKQGLSHNIYYPLLKETIKKVEYTSPLSMQTGPAKRKDYKTIQSHIKLLQTEFPEYEALYRILTDYIIEFTCKPKP